MPIEKSPYKSTGGPKRIIAAFKYSINGIAAACRHEAAFRQELAMALVLIPLGLYLGDNAPEQILLVGSVLLVLIAELINSAIENLADAITTDHNPLIGRAKDQASAAILLTIILMLAIWAIILIKNIF